MSPLNWFVLGLWQYNQSYIKILCFLHNIALISLCVNSYLFFQFKEWISS